jgi:PhnB protein
MATFQPEGWRTVTPRIVVRDVDGLVEFIRNVFGATGEIRAGLPTEIKIGDSTVMVSGEGQRDQWPAFLYVYVEDIDATYQRAIEAGATSVEAPSDMPYGDRRAMVNDDWGNVWQMATHQHDLSLEQVRDRVEQAGKP